MALLFKHAYEDPVPLDQKAANVPCPVVPVVMKALATAPEDRYHSAESFAVALAEACTSVWGPGWLAAEGVPVMGAGPVVAATERMSMSPTGQAPAGAYQATSGAAAGGAAGPTVVRQPPPPPLQRARATVVRPASTQRLGGTGLTELQAGLAGRPRPRTADCQVPAAPRLSLAIAVAAFAAAVVLAFVGVGSGTSLGGTVPPGRWRSPACRSRSGVVPSLDLVKPGRGEGPGQRAGGNYGSDVSLCSWATGVPTERSIGPWR